jgi:dienelactone hydrolase
MKHLLFSIGCIVLMLSCKPAAEQTEAPHVPVIQSTEVSYTIDSIQFGGWMAWDSANHEKRPGVIVVHEWWGHNDYARKRAQMLADSGYVAFAIDMYGDGKQADHPDSAIAYLQQSFATTGGAQPKFERALQELHNHPMVDQSRIAAIGYCFGGFVVLEMARAGLDLDGVISYHGSLGTETPAKENQIKGEVLVFTGAADPLVPEAEVKGFEAEMDSAGVAYKVVRFADAKHAFTNPAADSLGKKFEMPLAYHASADSSSWAESLVFLDRVLKMD